MKSGDQIGPFTIEKLLGAGAMGAVYRGIYAKTGRKVAIKVMLPGVAENTQSAERFHREIAILKQLNHPNITRLLHDGEHEGSRFYAMEYIQGESLDKTLARRDRFSWEEVVALGQQLCAALQHAHDKGVVHRDLKPSNLMILADGTLKLTDFGIAKDLDVTQLTEANCTVGTASYMSPEQCRGERNLTHKSDLYSLGIVIYELLTGKKPFISENVMDMFMMHVKGKFERPSRIVVDIPNWLDVLVCQLMEKKPEQRPRDAATVGKALGEVLEKVEARQSAGVEKARAGGVAPADRTTAYSMLEKKSKKKKTKKQETSAPWHQRTWVKAAGLLAALAAVVLVGWLMLKPESEEKLYSRIQKMMQSGDHNRWTRAYEKPIPDYLRRFGSQDSERTRQVRVWSEQVADHVGIFQKEEDLAKSVAAARKIDISKMDALDEAGRKAVKAAQAEEEGNLTNAAFLWGKLIEEHGKESVYWGKLAERRVRVQYKEVEKLKTELAPPLFDRLEKFHKDELKFNSPEEEKAFTAFRFEKVGDLPEARLRWQNLKEDTQGDPQSKTWFLLAASKARDLETALSKSEDKRTPLEIVKEHLKQAEKFDAESEKNKAVANCRNIIELYRGIAGFKEVVDAAEKLREHIQ